MISFSDACLNRWRARFNVFYQGKESIEIRQRIDLKPEDMERYRAANPEEAAKLDRIKAAARITSMFRRCVIFFFLF